MVQGATPIPYKLVTIASGLAGVPFLLFMLYSAVTRTIRYIVMEAMLVHFFGEKAQALLEKYLELALVVFLYWLVLGFVALSTSGDGSVLLEFAGQTQLSGAGLHPRRAPRRAAAVPPAPAPGFRTSASGSRLSWRRASGRVPAWRRRGSPPGPAPAASTGPGSPDPPP